MFTIRFPKKLLLVIFLALAACGQRGPLFLPEKNSAPAPGPQSETTDTQQPEDEDDPGA